MAELEDGQTGICAAKSDADGAVAACSGGARSGLARLLELMAGMSGLFVGRLTPIRVFVTATIVAAWPHLRRALA